MYNVKIAYVCRYVYNNRTIAAAQKAVLPDTTFLLVYRY